ncbi:MAG: SdiA-regulated domain-containing protein [Candidatus Brocadiaceae bacterium]|jgi:hypothetical protein
MPYVARRASLALLPVCLCVWVCNCGPPQKAPASAPSGLAFRYEWVGDIEESGFNEPSGIVFHAARGTLFVVGDEGDICEMTTDGQMLRQRSLQPKADLEGLAVVPRTGLLYVAVEGAERILEIDPEGFSVMRQFTIPRWADGEELFKPGGQGIEGICFVPEPGHPHGGTFFVANQSFTEEPGRERSLIVQVELPLGSASTEPVRVLKWFPPGVIDIGALHYQEHTGHLFAVSDAQNMLIEMDAEGRALRCWAFPGANQEGLTTDREGFMYVAQDSGGVIKIRPLWRTASGR